MKNSLDKLRKEIDAIDTEIFALMQNRLKIVAKVGELKKSSTNKPIIRPGREASMLQKIYDKAKKSGYTKKTSLAFANLWRSIIILGVNYEDDIEILTKNATDQALAKEYLGRFATIKTEKSNKNIIKKLSECTHSIAVLEALKNYTTEPWWLSVSKNHNLKIFAKIPLLENIPQNIFAFANITPEPTGHDKFLYVINGKLPKNIADDAKIISKYKTHTLIELEEFYNDFEKPISAVYLGCYSYLAI